MRLWLISNRCLETAAASIVALVIAFSPQSAFAQTRVTVLSSNGLRAVVQELVPQFENATGNQVAISFSVAAELKKRIEGGEPFDLAILTPVLIDDLIKQGRIVPASRTAIARTGMALAIRRGAAKPDLRTVDSLKAALVASPSIAFAREGAGGLFFTALVQRLGLAPTLTPKFKTFTTGDEVREAVARGDAALGVMPVSEILPAPAIEVGGMFPSAVQDYAVMVAGVSQGSTRAAAARALIDFLMAPAASSVVTNKGMERVPK
jgi:molybdate transport system substrate-binding protein